MPEKSFIYYNKTTTVFKFLVALTIVSTGFLLYSRGSIAGLLLPLIFIFHFTLLTANFIGLFRKNPPLTISREGIIYRPYNMFVSVDQIKMIYFIEGSKGYIKIYLKKGTNKYHLPQSLFGKIMISGGGLNFSDKNQIVLLLHGLSINEEEFNRILIDQKLNKLKI